MVLQNWQKQTRRLDQFQQMIDCADDLGDTCVLPLKTMDECLFDRSKDDLIGDEGGEDFRVFSER